MYYIWESTVTSEEHEHDIRRMREGKRIWSRCTTETNKMNGRQGKQGMKRDEETVCGDFKGEEGWGKEMEKEKSKELVMERFAAAHSVSGLFSRRPWRGGFEWSYQFLSWALQKRPAARGEGVTRSLARDGWRREAGSASTGYIIIHLLLSPKPPASEPLTHQDTFLLQPKAAWLIYTDTQAGQWENIQKLL